MLKTILMSSGSNIAVLLVKIALTFVMAPVLLENLGNYDYGLWEMLGAVIGYMGMLDMGIKPAISRFTATTEARQDYSEQNQLFNSSLIFMAIVGVIIAIFFVAFGTYYPELLAENSNSTHQYSLLCFILGAQLLISFPGYVAESMLEGMQWYAIKNSITIINSLLGAAILYNYIDPSNGIVLLAAVNAIGLSIKFVIYFYILLIKKIGKLKVSAQSFSLPYLINLLKFGAKSMVLGVAYRIETATDSLVIGTMMSPAMVPFYSIPANLVSYIRTVSGNLCHVFLPIFSGLAESKDPELANVYLKGSKWIVACMLLLSCGVSLLGYEFLMLWIGKEYAEKAQILIYILVAFTVLPTLNPFATRYLTAINKHSILAKWYPVTAAVNLVLSIILGKLYGLEGIAIGSLIPGIATTYFFLTVTCKYLNISPAEYLKLAILPGLIPAIGMVATILLLKTYAPIGSWTMLLTISAVAANVYLLLFYIYGTDTDERQIISKIVRQTMRRV